MLFLKEFRQRRRHFFLSIFNNFLAISLLLVVNVFSSALLEGMEQQLDKMSLQVSCLNYPSGADAEVCSLNLVERYGLKRYSEFYLKDEEGFQLAFCRDLSRLFSLEFHLGGFFNDRQVAVNENAAVLGYQIWQDFGCPALGESFSLRGAQFILEGVLREGYENICFISDRMIFLPLGYREDADEARLFFISDQAYLDDYLDEMLGKDNYLLIQQKLLKSSFTAIMKQGKSILMILSAFSLVISLLGMMNQTLSSLKGRYREIGIKKALGAGEADIIRQFLLEALLIMLASCLAAMAAEELIIKTASLFSLVGADADRHHEVIIWIVPVGCAFCLYPAYKAGQVSVMEAIRH
ncbi:MAG: ABC transporter permease [Erysipelotrichaceae bacterium]|nr:ABC transporter permease [Erysipelotrichaceae bacterium]